MSAAAMNRVRAIAWIACGASLLVCLFGWFAEPQSIAGAYLSAWSAVWTLAVGSLTFEMIGRVSGARFAVTLRPVTSALQWLLPLAALLYIPMLWGAEHLYPWVEGGLSVPEEKQDAIAKVAAWYDTFGLGSVGLALRSAVYFLVILSLWWLLRGSRVRPARVSAFGLFVLGVLWTFASTDWWMAQRTSWVSTIYPAIKLTGGFCAAVAAISIYLCAGRGGERHPRRKLRHAIGTLLFAASCFWAYLVYCQTLLIWIADLPHENGYLLARLQNGYWQMSVAVTVLRFVTPFFLLLRKDAKQNAWTLGLAAAAVLVGHGLDEALAVLPEPAGAVTDLGYLLPCGLMTVAAAVASLLRPNLLQLEEVGALSKPQSKFAAQPYRGEVEHAVVMTRMENHKSSSQASDNLNSRRVAQVFAGALAVGAVALAFMASWLDGSEGDAPHAPSGSLQTSLYNSARARSAQTIPEGLRQRLNDQSATLLSQPPKHRWDWLEERSSSD